MVQGLRVQELLVADLQQGTELRISVQKLSKHFDKVNFISVESDTSLYVFFFICLVIHFYDILHKYLYTVDQIY